MEKATFGGGCFWRVEAAYRKVKGVLSTSVGYMGGHFENPSYLDVVSRITGHAEVAQIEYDPVEALQSDPLLSLRFNGGPGDVAERTDELLNEASDPTTGFRLNHDNAH